MARPRKRTTTPWDQEKVIEEMKQYFKLNYSINQACKLVGIPQSTVQTWIEKDPVLRLKINKWRNEISAKARNNWRDKVASKDYQASKEWLERREKADFSTRQEVTGEDGQPVTQGVSKQEMKDIISVLKKQGLK